MEKKGKRYWKLLIIVISTVIFFRYFFPLIHKKYVPELEDFYKESICRTELMFQGRDYIIAEYRVMTGIMWEAVEHHRGGLFPQYCDIVFDGIDSPAEMLSGIFFEANNKFVFYVSDYEEVKTEDFKTVPTYTVTDWTVLFPIWRSPSSGGSERYLTEEDNRLPDA